jgi:hypothetical protein
VRGESQQAHQHVGQDRQQPPSSLS